MGSEPAQGLLHNVVTLDERGKWELAQALAGDHVHTCAATFAEPRFDMDW